MKGGAYGAVYVDNKEKNVCGKNKKTARRAWGTFRK